MRSMMFLALLVACYFSYRIFQVNHALNLHLISEVYISIHVPSLTVEQASGAGL